MLHLICIIEVTAQVTEAMSLKFITDQGGRLCISPPDLMPGVSFSVKAQNNPTQINPRLTPSNSTHLIQSPYGSFPNPVKNFL